jgi:hypothetical protein
MIPIDSVFDRISSVLEGHHQIEVPSQSRITAIQNQNVTDGIKQKDPAQFAVDIQPSRGLGHNTSDSTYYASEGAELDFAETLTELSRLDNLEITMEPPDPPPEPKIVTQPLQSENSRPSRDRPFLDVLKRRVLEIVIHWFTFRLRPNWSFRRRLRPLRPPVEWSGDYDVRSLTKSSKLSP